MREGALERVRSAEGVADRETREHRGHAGDDERQPPPRRQGALDGSGFAGGSGRS